MSCYHAITLTFLIWGDVVIWLVIGSSSSSYMSKYVPTVIQSDKNFHDAVILLVVE